MEEKVLQIINQIRAHKGMEPLTAIGKEDSLWDVLGFTSFDLAELTVRIEDEFGVDIFEDGLIGTVGEIYEKLS